jgi:hypothetical protein
MVNPRKTSKENRRFETFEASCDIKYTVDYYGYSKIGVIFEFDLYLDPQYHANRGSERGDDQAGTGAGCRPHRRAKDKSIT